MTRPRAQAFDHFVEDYDRCLEFADHFDHVTGVDLSKNMVEYVQAKRPHASVSHRAQDLMDFEDDEGFDLVFSFTTLHHLPDLEAALKHLRQIARPGSPAGRTASEPPSVSPRHRQYRLSEAWLLGFRSRRPRYEHDKTSHARYGAGAAFSSVLGPRTRFWRN